MTQKCVCTNFFLSPAGRLVCDDCGAEKPYIEELIDEYWKAINAVPFDEKRCDELCQEVEAEADRCGFTDHARLYALHTAAEGRSIQEEK